MPSRVCEQCGRGIDGKSSRARFCSSTCRARRAEGAEPVHVDAPRPHRTTGRQVAAVTAELEAAGRSSSALGVAALVLAERVDGGSQETGAAFAALVKALRETLTAALAEAEASGDGVDEIRQRRERKMARAGG